MYKKLLQAIVPFILMPYIAVADVNENTGSMSATFPLFSMAGNTINLPISLSYSDGIKINQHASWVGTGFDISLPFIERIPLGSVDEKAGTFECSGPGNYSKKFYRKLITNTGNNYTSKPDPGWYTEQQDVYIMSASFGGGRIVFAQPPSANVPMQAYLQNWRPLKIIYRIDNNDDIYRWDVIDENGTTYIFGQPVKAEVDYSYNGNTAEMYSDYGTIQDHYVNPTFNRRWYLTEIRSANYDALSNKCELISISYSSYSSTYKVLVADLFYYAQKSTGQQAVTGLFKYKKDMTTSMTRTYTFDNYYIHPIYPVEIISPGGKAKFYMSSTSTKDNLVQGDKSIDRIELYSKNSTNYVLSSQIKFNYDANGLAAGHPYSSSGKGLLQLNSVTNLSADGQKSMPMVSFSYFSNPSFAPPSCFYKHDFYGYYSNKELSGNYSYPDGQSMVGTPAAPGAEAWSVYKVTHGNGLVTEYEYEPNAVTMLSTNQTITTEEMPMKPGFRVKTCKVYDGISANPITTTYEYETGFTDHDNLVLPTLGDFYTLLNDQGMQNVMVFSTAYAQYTTCKRKSMNTGLVKTYFLSPSSVLPIYESNPVKSFSLSDVYLTDGMSVNSLAHYRGMAWKIENFKQSDLINPIASCVNDFAINYNVYSYVKPKVIPLPTFSCSVSAGGNSGIDEPERADNQSQSDFIGFVRLTKTTDMKDGVSIRNDILSYNNTNGLPNKTRTTHSHGNQKLSKTIFAFENSAYSAAMGPGGANMLTVPCQSVVYEKAAGDNSVDPLASEIRSAQATTWSNTLGTAAWVPSKSYVWKANFKADRTPDQTYVDFNHASGAANTNWQLTGVADKYNINGGAVQSSNALGISSAVLMSNDNTLPIASVSNARHGECFFTSFEEETPWSFNNGGSMVYASDHRKNGDKAGKVVNNGTTEIYADAQWKTLDVGLVAAKKFTFSGWVYTTGPQAELYFFTSVNGTSYEGGHYTNVKTPADAANKWVFLQGTFEAPAGAKYFTIRVDNNGKNGTATDVYFDDLKFYPSNALMSVMYYDAVWRKPILTVDANENPGELIEFDTFGKPIKRWQIDKTKDAAATGYKKYLKSVNEYFISN